MQDTNTIIRNIAQLAADLETFFRPEEERVSMCFHTPINDDESCQASNKDTPTKPPIELFTDKYRYEDGLSSSSPSLANAHSCLETHEWSSETDSEKNRERTYDKESEDESRVSTSISTHSSLLISSSTTSAGTVDSDTDIW